MGTHPYLTDNKTESREAVHLPWSLLVPQHQWSRLDTVGQKGSRQPSLLAQATLCSQFALLLVLQEACGIQEGRSESPLRADTVCHLAGSQVAATSCCLLQNSTLGLYRYSRDQE
jgi:hypothetical protein